MTASVTHDLLRVAGDGLALADVAHAGMTVVGARTGTASARRRRPLGSRPRMAAGSLLVAPEAGVGRLSAGARAHRIADVVGHGPA